MLCVCQGQGPYSSTPAFLPPLPSLQTIDRFNNLLVTAFVTPGSTRFLLLHDGRHDEGIRQFFVEVYELYVRVSMGKVWERLGGRLNRFTGGKVRHGWCGDQVMPSPF